MHHSTNHIVDADDIRYIGDIKASVHDAPSSGDTIFALVLGSATSVFACDPAIARKYFAAVEAAAHELVLAADQALTPTAVSA